MTNFHLSFPFSSSPLSLLHLYDSKRIVPLERRREFILLLCLSRESVNGNLFVP